jgi:hypothetical protein
MSKINISIKSTCSTSEKPRHVDNHLVVNGLLVSYPPMAQIENPCLGMVIIVRNGNLYQLQEVVGIDNGNAVMAPYITKE